MRLPRRSIRVVLVVAFVGGRVSAQQAPIPVRPIGPIVARVREPLANISGVRVLSDGRMLLNDNTAKRVLLFDSTLTRFITVADTTSGTKKAYGSQGGALRAFDGDSSLFVDRASTSLLVIDPAGAINRVIAVPDPTRTLLWLGSPFTDVPYDGAGHFLYRTEGAALGLIPNGTVQVVWSDSAAIVRIDIATRKTDTLARLKTLSQSRRAITLNDAGKISSTMTASVRALLTPSDDWALMPDGTVAVVRYGDYHVDWIARDGTRTSSPKIEHEWDRLTDSMKSAMIDSIKGMDSVSRAKAAAARDSAARATGSGAPTGSDGAGRAGGGGGGGGGAAASSVLSLAGFGPLTTMYQDPGDVPDYWPPFRTSGSTMADAAGNLWIKTGPRVPLPGGPVYDVVNRKGVLVDRVQVPGGTTIVAFGQGVAYLTSREGSGMQLVRVRIR